MDLTYPLFEEPAEFVRWLFERLQVIPDIEWDKSFDPRHCSYGDWYIWGDWLSSDEGASTAVSASASTSRPGSHSSPGPSPHSQSPGGFDGAAERSPVVRRRIIARISKQMLRLERQYQLCKTTVADVDPEGKHHARALQIFRLPPRTYNEFPLCVLTHEWDGTNHLSDLVECGPSCCTASAASQKLESGWTANRGHSNVKASLPDFLDFAVGAAECCEMLHQGGRLVHGELRPDSFFFNRHTRVVKLLNLGAGLPSLENGLTSAGWSILSQEFGVKHKLQYVAPEQTGRLPAAPDSRTDIYSLGILFWCMLTGDVPFPADTPLGVMQALLSRRVPSLSHAARADIPDSLSAIIQRMVCRNINERYNSATGVKCDLKELRKLLCEGDHESLQCFKTGSKDVNCFFNLPNIQVGRHHERQVLLDIIDKVGKAREWGGSLLGDTLTPINSVSSNSESHRNSSIRVDDFGSDAGSAVSTPNPALDSVQLGNSHSNDPVNGLWRSVSALVDEAGFVSHSSMITSPHEEQSSATKSTIPAMDTILSRYPGTLTHRMVSAPSSSAIKSTQKFRRKDNCDVVTVSGVAGLGKSRLVQSVQSAARKHGYFAAAKFDMRARLPFEPVLRAISSLFRTIFSEPDITRAFHDAFRSFIRPVWPFLHETLGLPLWLLNPEGSIAKAGDEPQVPSLGGPRTSSPANHRKDVRCGRSGHTVADFLKTGMSSQSSRLLAICLDVLRFLSAHKFLLICFDDLQFADSESLDLIQGLLDSKISLVLVLTYRERDLLSPRIKQMLDGSSTNITKIQLLPLTEDNIAEYITATTSRSREDMFPLAAVIMEKSGGNPFFMREMLDSCYRKACLWYDWKLSAWSYDLDKILKTFESDDTDFIMTRLLDLPSGSRKLLAWASLLGRTFSFALVKRLMHETGTEQSPKPVRHESEHNSIGKAHLIRQPSQDAVKGLQSAIAAYIIRDGETEDQFQFCHDRYQQAAGSLLECSNIPEMHFSITQAMMQNDYGLTDAVYIKSSHICQSIDLIKVRIGKRSAYRNVLFQAAEKAVESGGRAVALNYFINALALLQNSPWDESSSPDIHYEETLTLYTKTGECYFSQDFTEPALALLNAVFKHGRTALDRAPSWVLQSRIHARHGDNEAAFESLHSCLSELDVELPETSWEECDNIFHSLRARLENLDREKLFRRPLSEDRTLSAIGTVMCEIVTAALWTDALRFYQIGLIHVQILLDRGTTIQAGLALTHFGACAIGRHDLIELACDFGNLARSFYARFKYDSYTLGRAEVLHCMFIGHLCDHPRDLELILKGAMEASLSAGDRFSGLLNIGYHAAVKFWQSQDLNDVEAFCRYGPEEFIGWQVDVRGGLIITAISQFCRALRGVTYRENPATVLCDAEHDTKTYLDGIKDMKPQRFYHSYVIMAQYMYGHYDAAVRTGEELSENMNVYWSSRFVMSTIFYLSLSYLAIIRDRHDEKYKALLMDRAHKYRLKLIKWSAMNDANFRVWAVILAAGLHELDGKYDSCPISYESALDQCELHGLVYEQALTLELYAEFLIRRGAKRLGRNMLRDSIGAYRQISAFGKAVHIAEKHELLLQGTTSVAMADAGCQTLCSKDNRLGERISQNEEAVRHMPCSEVLADRSWNSPGQLGMSHEPQPPELATSGLDFIDLTSVLKSSQVLSSELHVDKLHAKMTDIILESTGADLCALIVEDADIGWTVAAVRESSTDLIAVVGQSLDVVEDVVGKQITLYTLRFRESVFLDNNFDDDRFPIPDVYREKNPGGRAVLTMPILRGDRVLGCVYLEGPPHTFRQRSITVLQLLVNAIGIAITNAALFKKVEKVSASNLAMVESQKHALLQAREAEKKAKLAEAEAIRNVKLQEEAVKAKSIFLANVSHELRTPLNGVIGMSELLKGSKLSTDQESYADSIRMCADTLLTVINDILDFSKLEAGKMQTYSVPLSLTETIGEVVRALSYTNKEKDLKTVMQLDLTENMLVMGDPVRLHQILMNLLSNSYKFTARGSVTVKATVVEESDKDIKITCSVADTGVGVSEEQQKLLFLPFSQADSSTARSYGGTGLGLSICKAIVENVMGGKIWLESQPGLGTTVFFTLTFQKASNGLRRRSTTLTNTRSINATTMLPPAAESNPSRLSRPGADLHTVPKEQLRICVAEDNPINQKIAVSFVRRFGFQCEAFGDGQQTYNAVVKASAAGNPFHVILMDVQMPQMDGYDAARAIRQHEDPAVNEVLIIAMTASAIRGDREKCLQAGMNNYLAKPVRQQVLKQMLDGYLNTNASDMSPAEADTTAGLSDITNGQIQSPGADRNGNSAKSLAHSKGDEHSINETAVR